MEASAYESMQVLQADHWWWRGMRSLYRAALQRFWLKSASRNPVRVLDVGCGFGANLPVWSSLRPEMLVGVDISRDALRTIEPAPGLTLIQARADQLPFRSGVFDVIGLLAVIEHVERDDYVLQESHRVARPNALLLLLTSAFKLLWSHHDIANGHLRRYRMRDALRRIEGADWLVLTASYVNAVIFPLVLVVRVIQRILRSRGQAAYDMGPNPFPLNRILEGELAVEGWLILRTGLRMPFGVDLFSVCKRQ